MQGRTRKRPARGGSLEAGRQTACATRVLAGARTCSQISRWIRFIRSRIPDRQGIEDAH